MTRSKPVHKNHFSYNKLRHIYLMFFLTVSHTVFAGPIRDPGSIGSIGKEEYAFVKQIFNRDRFGIPELPYVDIQLAHDPSWGPPYQWEWYVKNPSDNEIKDQLTFTWYAQASCPDDLAQLQISGPGGSVNQNPLINPIAGYFSYQGFSVKTIKDICINWAKNHNCDPLNPLCDQYAEFDITGGVAPAASDLIHLKATCSSGIVTEDAVGAMIHLRCDRGEKK